MPTNEQPSIQTGGGATTNDVTTGGGDFTGRDRIAYTINFFGPIEIKKETAQSPWQSFDWGKAEQTYRDSLIRHYGSLRVIGATVDAPLDNVFTDVFIHRQLTAQRRANIEELHQADPDSFRQAHGQQERVSGLTLIQQGMLGEYPTHFYILGKPGAGKTTFLKYITMQAARERTIDRIPIFVSLHEWTRSKNEDLFAFIVSRFAVCQVPDAAPFVKLLLEEGKALLVFDGLDEVRYEGKKRDRLTHQLRDFVRQYDRCQHLITCRIAASEYIFENFKTVEVADFTPEQIAAYAAKWFDEDKATYDFFMQELRKPEQKGVYELCNTPLLLSLVCLAFATDRAFPPTHAELYEDALDVLLKRWDASRQIDRDALHTDEKIYRELSPQRKKELFARIAYRTFQKGEYFFRRRDLEGWITDYLATLPNIKAVADLDGQIVLKAIEAQHSILVERAKEIYSFSHLTFQEYFTAHYLKQNQASGAVVRLIADHLGDDRWREVFLLTTSLLSEESANDFFFAMQQGVDQLVEEDPVLLWILIWAERKGRTANMLAKWQGIVRLVYIFMAISFALDLAGESALAREVAREIESEIINKRDLSLALMRASTITSDLETGIASVLTSEIDLVLALTRARSRSNSLSREVNLVISRTRSISREITPHVAFDYSLFYAWSYARLFARETLNLHQEELQEAIAIYPRLIQVVIELGKDSLIITSAHLTANNPTPLPTDTSQSWQNYANALFAILQQREFEPEWKISIEQIKILNHYFAANELSLQCLKVATVTNRQAILNGILEPPVLSAEDKPAAVEAEKKASKPWWKLW